MFQNNDSHDDKDNNEDIGLFGRRYLICKTRKRVTEDGGASILATSSSTI